MTARAPLSILWVVDAQEDFMTPPAEGGRLYVGPQGGDPATGSVRLRQPIADLVADARAAGVRVVATADWHRASDPEIDAVAPNFQTTFPPHCMGGEPDPVLAAGAHLIREIQIPALTPLGSTVSPADAQRVTTQVLGQGDALLLQKTEFSIFTGSTATPGVLDGIETLAQQLDASGVEFVVIGVASDVCVTAAVEGLVAQGKRVRVLTDRIAGLGIVSDEDLATRWQQMGVSLDTAASWLTTATAARAQQAKAPRAPQAPRPSALAAQAATDAESAAQGQSLTPRLAPAATRSRGRGSV